MKNKLLLLMVIVSTIFFQEAIAQLPQTSTADNPKWYYIQVVGSGSSRENRVFNVKETNVIGSVLSATNSNQLFRFEKENDKYFIITKSNKKLAAGKNGTVEAVVLNDVGTLFSFTPYENYFTLKSSSPAPGGSSDKLYVHQSSASDYKITLEVATWETALNSQFAFVPLEDVVYEYSTDKKVIWYNIRSAKEGNEAKGMTDVSSSDSDIKIALEEIREDNDYQLWKLVKKGARANIINKATGNYISSYSVVSQPNIKYNYIQANPENESSGWAFKHIREAQYTIAGVDNDKITRYLTAATEGIDPTPYDASALFSSDVVWKLKKVKSEDYTSLPNFETEDNILIYSRNQKIIVEGAEDYAVRTIQGTMVAKNIELPVGIYLVTVNGKTTKLLVK